MLNELGAAATSPDHVPLVADLHFRRRRWSAAASELERIGDPDFSTAARLTLARNLAAIERRRLDVYEALASVTPDDRYAIVSSRAGRHSIVRRHQNGTTSLTPGPDPVAAVTRSMAAIRKDCDAGSPIALCGIGDGYLLAALAQDPPTLLLGRRQAVYVLEPDAQAVLAALCVHDYTGPDGPIEQGRFHWFVGPRWGELFHRAPCDDPYLPFPESHVHQGLDVAAIEAQLDATMRELCAIDARLANEAEAYYAKVGRDDLLAVFDANPPRPPRVLMVTSRFTTVLQYTTADAAAAFESLGWDAKVVIEPTPHHSLRRHAMRQAVVDFKPDLVFIVDHLRHEYDGVFPAGLPFAAWVLDHLPNLCDRAAAAKVDARQFVLTGLASHFAARYGYPRRQLIDLPNLSKLPGRPATWTSDGDDLVYVSNWSKPVAKIFDEVLSRAPEPGPLRTVLESAAREMISIYEAGGSLPAGADVRRVLVKAQRRAGLEITDAALGDNLVNLLFDRLDNALYRHQAIRWAAEIADRHGLRFALYGNGWEENPEFARFARGPVKPGADAEALLRRSKINLQLEPFACFSHPRLLTGLFAGGFFLVRDHPHNHVVQRLLNFIERHLPATVTTSAEARAAIAPRRRAALERAIDDAASAAEQLDPVSLARDWQRGGLLIAGRAESLPRLNDVAFSDPPTLEAAVVRFLGDEGSRRAVADAQRASLESRLTYEAGLSRTVREIRRVLASEPVA